MDKQQKGEGYFSEVGALEEKLKQAIWGHPSPRNPQRGRGGKKQKQHE